MTRILFRPAELPRHPMRSHQLHGSWNWWWTRLSLGFPLIHARDSFFDLNTCREASLTFNRELDPDTELVNPPVTRVVTTRRVADWGDRRIAMMTSERTDIYIVWWGTPGPGWGPLPGNTCRPGDYRIETTTEFEDRPRGRVRADHQVDLRDCYELRHEDGQPLLEWPHPPRAEWRRRWERTIFDINREQIADMYGIPVELIAPLSDLDRVGFVMLHTGDPGDDGTANPASVRLPVEFGPDGACRSDVITWQVGAGTFTAFSLWDGALTDADNHLIVWNPLLHPVTMTDTGMISLTDLNITPEIAALLPTVGRDSGWQNLGYTDRLRSPVRRVGRRDDPRRAPKTGNPEQPVLDAIDELVNEQLRAGPRDDYSKPYRELCELCGEGWHGLTGIGANDSFGHPSGQHGCPGAFATEEEIRRWRRES
jgi:hypothetical protein